MLLAALSTGHKIGLGLVGAAFVGFALVSAFLIPSFRPDFPGRRGLPAFLTVSVALFVGMMFAVFFFGREPSEGHAAQAANTTQPSPPPPPPPATTAPTTTQSTTTTPSTTNKSTTAAPKSVSVSETEWKIALPSTSLTAGKYTFDVKNDGHIPHDLTINGPGVSNGKTPLINPGKSAKLAVELKSGSYDFYCSVPGHKAAGMDVKVTVS
ncbi:MAG: plastocyanin/azurin family copper-binding protein [Gaiellaceae bacterium]